MELLIYLKIVMKVLILISALFSTVFSATATVDTQNCTLSHRTPTKAFPSLIKCYRNNINSCCVSAHDNFIKQQMGSLLPDACDRNFIELELYFCYGCSF